MWKLYFSTKQPIFIKTPFLACSVVPDRLHLLADERPIDLFFQGWLEMAQLRLAVDDLHDKLPHRDPEGLIELTGDELRFRQIGLAEHLDGFPDLTHQRLNRHRVPVIHA